jgi:hypothetical protein
VLNKNVVFLLRFDDRIASDWTDTVSGVRVVGGQRSGEREADEPFAVYKRGVMFRANQFLTLIAFELHHTFTLQSWIRPEDPGLLFSSERSEHLFSFGLSD